MPESQPMYHVATQDDGTERMVCLYCDHWATDGDLFRLHMAQRHNGEMVEEPGATPEDGEGDPVPPEMPVEETPASVPEDEESVA